jgi:hypothetical protein
MLSVAFSHDVALTARVHRLPKRGLPAVVLIHLFDHRDDDSPSAIQGTISITAEQATALAEELRQAATEAQSMNAGLRVRL